MNFKQKVRWSNAVKIITWIALPLLVYAEYTLVSSILRRFDFVLLLITLLVPVILFYFLFQMATFIEVYENQLIIHRLRGSLIIPINQIKGVNALVASFFHVSGRGGLLAYIGQFWNNQMGHYRLFGSGGLFGYIGRFRNKQIGDYQSYIGNYSQSFWIELENGKKYALSCEQSEELIDFLKQQIA